MCWLLEALVVGGLLIPRNSLSFHFPKIPMRFRVILDVHGFQLNSGNAGYIYS
jgi:hypothetical protein